MYYLTTTDLVQAATVLQLPIESEKEQLEQALTSLAEKIAAHLEINCETRDIFAGAEFGGTLVGFYPRHANQPLPELFDSHVFDDACGWEYPAAVEQ